MKILQICNKVPFPAKDGGAIATFNLSKGFANNGYDVTILTLNTKKHYVKIEDLKGLPQNISIKGVDIDTGISVKKALHNLFFSHLPYNAIRFLSGKFRKVLTELLQNEKFDIIQIEGIYMMLYIDTIRKYSDAKVALRAHNIEHEIWLRTAERVKNFLKRQYIKNLAERIKAFELKMIDKYDILIPITERDAESFKQFGNKSPLHVCPVGINTENIKITQEPDYPSLFHLGALDWPPNQEGLIWFLYNCWDKISENYPKLKFYIAGRNAPDWFIKSIKKKNVEYFGEIDNASDFLSSKAIMIVPLLSGSGMRVKIIEGMAHGKTIISTSIGAEGINCVNNENIFIADSIDDFKAAVEKLISDEALFKRIGENAKQFALKKFNNNALSLQMINFYKQQLNPNNSGLDY